MRSIAATKEKPLVFWGVGTNGSITLQGPMSSQNSWFVNDVNVASTMLQIQSVCISFCIAIALGEAAGCQLSVNSSSRG